MMLLHSTGRDLKSVIYSCTSAHSVSMTYKYGYIRIYLRLVFSTPIHVGSKEMQVFYIIPNLNMETITIQANCENIIAFKESNNSNSSTQFIHSVNSTKRKKHRRRPRVLVVD